MSSALTKECLTFDKRASTPPEVRKYRRSNNLAPGKRFLHYGVADDYKTMGLEEKIYGKVDTEKHVTAQDLINHQKPSDLERINLMKAEMNYRQSTREPLGRVPDRKINLPQKFTEDKEAFGVKTQSSMEPAKNIIFPVGRKDESKEEEIYKRSHGSYGVGEMLTRDYKWDVDENTRFGVKGNTIALNGVSTNIAEVLHDPLEGPDVIQNKRVEDFRNTKNILGQSKNLGQGSSSRPFDMVYGKSSASKGIGAGEIIKGKYTDEQNRPDRDLGKSITPGFRNISFEDRAYGCPSIRSDVPKLPAEKRSLADSQNYGDDVPCQDLINPPAFSDLSIGPLVMQDAKDKEYLRSIFSRIGYNFSEEEFDKLFLQASHDGGQTATINAFRDAVNVYIIEQEIY